MRAQHLRSLANRLLRCAGVRVVNAEWGPRGFAASFRKLARQGVRPARVLDVGAASGTWTLECMEVFPEAEYVMVDPLEENRSALQRIAGAYPNARYLMGALGASNGSLELRIHGDQSSFFASEFDAGETARRVPVVSLDKLIDDGITTAPDILKADVQGYELQVLLGAARALVAVEFVLLEVSYREAYAGSPLAHDVIAAMGRQGFRIYDICTYAQRPRDHELFQSEILFARKDSRVFSFEGYE